MPIQVIPSTSNTTPDPDLGGLAVTSAGNTGHGSTTVTASGGTDQQEKSCRWGGFSTAPSGATSLTLKIGFSRNGTLSDGGVDTFNEFHIQYSLNSGSSWTAVRLDQFVTSSSSGTQSVALSTSQDLTQVLVRDSLTAVKTGAVSATLTATISGIQIEAEVPDLARPITIF